MAGKATNAIPALLAFFPSHYSIAEPLAAAAVEKISPDVTTRVVVPLLLRDFQNTNPGIRLGALTALCQMADPKAVPLAVLQEALDDPYERVRQEALWKLSRMPDQRALAVPALIRVLDDPEPLVRNNAVIFLWNIGPEARAAAPKLITLTNDPDSGLRQNVIRALLQIDPGRWATNRP